MSEFLASAAEMLLGRTSGPMALRLILQPSMATFLAIRAGLKDAREGRTPYLWALVSSPSGRKGLIREGWRQVRMVFLVALILDVIYQIMVFHWVYLGQALIVATVLAIVPYLCLRGIVARLARTPRRKDQER